MENKQSAEQTEHFGIGRTKWRITILVIFCSWQYWAAF